MLERLCTGGLSADDLSVDHLEFAGTNRKWTPCFAFSRKPPKCFVGGRWHPSSRHSVLVQAMNTNGRQQSQRCQNWDEKPENASAAVPLGKTNADEYFNIKFESIILVSLDLEDSLEFQFFVLLIESTLQITPQTWINPYNEYISYFLMELL